METVKRRLELLKMEGLGFEQPDIVKHLSEKFQCSARAVYYDFASRSVWQPVLTQLEDADKILLKVRNRYEYIYREASVMRVQAGKNISEQLGALNTMLKATMQLQSTAVKTPELGTAERPLIIKKWSRNDADPTATR